MVTVPLAALRLPPVTLVVVPAKVTLPLVEVTLTVLLTLVPVTFKLPETLTSLDKVTLPPAKLVLLAVTVTVPLVMMLAPETLTLLPTTGPVKVTVPLGAATDTWVAVPVTVPLSDLMLLTLLT